MSGRCTGYLREKEEPGTDARALMARRRLQPEKQIHYKTMSYVKLLEMDRGVGELRGRDC